MYNASISEAPNLDRKDARKVARQSTTVFSQTERALIHWFVLLIFIVPFQSVIAEQLPVKVYTTADGLGSSAIRYIMRDSRGFLWFCTRDGLSRFDGVRFTTYTIGQNPSYPTINHILETRGGDYLIAAHGGGIYRFNPKAPQMTADPTPDDSNNRILSNAEKVSEINVGTLFEDRSGNRWAGADRLYQLEETETGLSLQPIELNLPVNPEKASSVNGFKEGRDGSLWLITGGSVTRRLPDGRTIQHILPPSLGDDVVTALEEDHQGRMWIGHIRGLYVLNPESLASLSSVDKYAVRLLPALKRDIGTFAAEDLSQLAEGEAVHYAPADGLPENPVTGLLNTTNGRMWIATNKGLTVFDGDRMQNFSDSQGISETSGGVLAEDIEGNLWVGNQSGGARKLLTHGVTTFDKSDGLGDLRIHSIYENQNGELHVVSGNYLISRFDERVFHTARANLPADARVSWTSNVGFLDTSGGWWMTSNLGLYRFPGPSGVEEISRRHPVVYSERIGVKSDFIYRVFEDKSGDMWISTRSGHLTLSGLTKWQRTTNTFHIFTEAEGFPPQTAPSAFAQDRAGNLWIGFYEGGLARYKDGRFTVFTIADGVPPSFITALYLDRSDRLWISSAMGGLSRVDDTTTEHPQFVSYTTAAGLSSNNVRCIVEDLGGSIYAGTVRGVDRLDPQTGKIRHYGLSEGLADDFVNVAYRDRKGALWFGTPRGLSRLQPEPERVRNAPPILISGLRISGVQQSISELGESEIPALALDHTQNNLQVDFFSLNFDLGENVRYQYQLEGADADWSEPTAQRSVNYPNIPAGSYRFLVRAVNTDDNISIAPASISFTVLRPIWQRWWFVTLVSCALAVFVYGLYRYRLAQLLHVERTRTRIATDLHDDIGASLSRIALVSEFLKQQNGTSNKSSDRLTQIASDARGVVDSMSDIVWSIDPRSDSLSSVVSRLRSFASDTLGELNIKWTLETTPDLRTIRLSSEVRRALYLILKEAIINIARHAHARNAHFTIDFDRHNILVEVQDDGCGMETRPVADSRGGHGLDNMGRRAAELGGHVEIKSSDLGTRLIISLPRTKIKSMFMLIRPRRK